MTNNDNKLERKREPYRVVVSMNHELSARVRGVAKDSGYTAAAIIRMAVLKFVDTVEVIDHD